MQKRTKSHIHKKLFISILKIYQSRSNRRDRWCELVRYARNNPINNIDPSGMDSVTVGGYKEEPGINDTSFFKLTQTPEESQTAKDNQSFSLFVPDRSILRSVFPPRTGKTQARKEFFPLVDSLTTSASAVEITDHDKPVAILLSYQHYIALTSKLCMLSKTKTLPQSADLIGSIKLKTDNLEAASEQIAKQFERSLNDTANSL